MTPPEPNPETMRRHLERVARNSDQYGDGLIEIAYDLRRDGAPNGAQLFKLSELKEAVEFAADTNRMGHNVWLGVALRNPTAVRGKRTDNSAFYASLFVAVDTDKDTEQTGLRLDAIATPEMVVTTGTIPELRQHRWYRLSKPCTDARTFALAVERVVKHVGGDASALGAGRLMRLAGSVAYPKASKRRDSYVNELTTIELNPEAGHVDIETFLTLNPRNEPPQDEKSRQHDEEDGDDFFRNVNWRALRDLEAWVPTIFGFDATKQPSGGYRVKSENLGRDLEEDLSIHPEGIKDFGVHDLGDPRGGRRSAIDVVIKYHGVENGIESARGAALWLCRQLNINPRDIGWRDKVDDEPTAPGESDQKNSEYGRRSNRQSPDELVLAAWLNRDLPPRDYLLGSVLCSTSRWLIWGDTGIGKTLLACEMGGAMAAGAPFLNWEGRRRARVMYLDGEMPAETFKERMVLVANQYGGNIPLFGYNREVLGLDEMPPLNNPEGVAWLWREIDIVKPDVIFFDSIMCLLAGSMAEEESWAPVKLLIRKISSRRIAQIWLHHTGHDASRGFGTKTREWEMDTVASLTKQGDDRVLMEFRKARLRTPQTVSEFRARTIVRGDSGWTAMADQPGKVKSVGEIEGLMGAILAAYDRLAAGVEASADFEGALVKKIPVELLREEVRSRGMLETKPTGGLTDAARTRFHRAKASLLSRSSGGLVECEGLIWRTDP